MTPARKPQDATRVCDLPPGPRPCSPDALPQATRSIAPARAGEPQVAACALDGFRSGRARDYPRGAQCRPDQDPRLPDRRPAGQARSSPGSAAVPARRRTGSPSHCGRARYPRAGPAQRSSRSARDRSRRSGPARVVGRLVAPLARHAQRTDQRSRRRPLLRAGRGRSVCSDALARRLSRWCSHGVLAAEHSARPTLYLRTLMGAQREC
jgi:hypothetical protein